MHSGTPGIPGSLPELLGVTSCMAIQAAVRALAYEESDHKKSRHIAFRPWKGHRSYITILDSCAVKCIRPHYQEPERLEDEMEFTGFHFADE